LLRLDNVSDPAERRAGKLLALRLHHGYGFGTADFTFGIAQRPLPGDLSRREVRHAFPSQRLYRLHAFWVRRIWRNHPASTGNRAAAGKCADEAGVRLIVRAQRFKCGLPGGLRS
jgi:hypothetical protein